MSEVGTRIHVALRGAMKHKLYTFPAVLVLFFFGAQVQGNAQNSLLGSAASFGVLAGSAVTNTGFSVIQGNLGVDPGAAITGFPPGIVNGTIHSADAVALQAQTDLTTAYNKLAGMTSTANVTGQDLGGLTLTPGVYTFSSSAQLTGPLVLNAQGDPNALFVFQIGSTLTTASASSVQVINGGADSDCNIYWQIGSSATLGTTTDFQGSIVALTSITLDTGADILDGSALARNGAVTLDDNNIEVGDCCGGNSVVPEGQSILMFVVGSLPLLGLAMRRRA